jgi:hypothetical protein
MVRPDLVLLDDPQTHESAHSQTQNAPASSSSAADVLGMAGPGKTISAVMPCTVIAPGDFVDRILDRSKHPLWRGERTRMLRSMPTDLDAWERYFEVYARCAQREPPDFAEANAYYLAHRAELDAGAEASWPERKLPGEVSAVQHAMHLYFRDRRAFFAEYQNDPLHRPREALLPADPARGGPAAEQGHGHQGGDQPDERLAEEAGGAARPQLDRPGPWARRRGGCCSTTPTPGNPSSPPAAPSRPGRGAGR